MKKLFIPIVIGTGREEQSTVTVARFVYQLTQEFGFETALINIMKYATLRTVGTDEKNEKQRLWSEVVKRADGLIIVAPEYNYGYPGELKILFDKEYKNI